MSAINTIGIDIGSGAVKTTLFRTDGDRHDGSPSAASASAGATR